MPVKKTFNGFGIRRSLPKFLKRRELKKHHKQIEAGYYGERKKGYGSGKLNRV